MKYEEYDVEMINTRKAHIRRASDNALLIVSSLSVQLVSGIECKGFSFIATDAQVDFIESSSFLRA